MKLNFLPKRGAWSRLSFLMATMLLAVNFSYAQDARVTGNVKDETGVSLPGATVLVKGTTNGVVTDIDGNYSISAPSDGTLVFSFVGYDAQEQGINNRTSIDVSLAPSVQALEELVVVGYGEQKKVTVTGAVAQLQGKELVKSPAVDITNSLAGRLPGLVVIQESGEPGNDGANITIRGTNTFGNSDPLIVIDGVPERDGGLGRLSPQDIESISVLKDASAAIYGARAANGAIIITTKRGQSGQANIRFDFNQGWSQPTATPDLSSATQYGTLMNELQIYNQVSDPNEWGAAWDAFQANGAYTTSDDRLVNAPFSPEFFDAHAAGGDPWRYPDTDWFGDTFKNWAPQSRYNLQFDGGSEKLRYLVSMGYVDQDAIYENSATFYKQYSFRTNLDWQANDYIKANAGVVLRREDRNFPTEDAGAIFRMLMRGRPNEPAVWPTGEPGPDIENGQNPVAITTNATGYDRRPTDYVQTNASITFDQPWIEGLSLTLSGAVDYASERRKEWSTPWELYFWDGISFRDDGTTPLLEASVESNFTDPRQVKGNFDGTR
ncbi:MAG: SusC/RagA family TonB-linked outer membrane protein [Bacteroidota bacterium]